MGFWEQEVIVNGMAQRADGNADVRFEVIEACFKIKSQQAIGTSHFHNWLGFEYIDFGEKSPETQYSLIIVFPNSCNPKIYALRD